MAGQFLIFWASFSSILVAVCGCYIPLDMPMQRASLAVINDKIIFAGGMGGGNAPSDQVVIYDTVTKESVHVRLPFGRINIQVTGAGSTILFAGGSLASRPYSSIDVLNLDTLNITTVHLLNGRANFRSVVVGSKAYFYNFDLFFSFDMDTFNIENLPLNSRYIDSIITDGSFIYFLNNEQRLVDRFDPATGSWSNFRDNLENTVYTNLLYREGGLVIAFSPTRIRTMTVFGRADSVLDVVDDMRISSSVPILIGNFIYVAFRRTMVVHDITERTSFGYRMSHTLYITDVSAVAHDGTIYYTGLGQSNTVLTVNTRALIQPFPVSLSMEPFVVGSMLFWFQVNAGRLTTYDMSSQESANYEWTNPRNLLSSAVVPVGNKLLAISETSYDTFNFDTLELVSRDFSNESLLAFFWRHYNGDYAVFLIRGNTFTIPFYDASSDTWTFLERNTSRQCSRTLVVSDRLVLLCGHEATFLEVYDIPSSQWLDPIPLGSGPPRDVSFTIVGPVLFLFATETTDSGTIVHTYNASNSQHKTISLAVGRTAIRIDSVHDEWVVFFGGLNRDNTLATRMDFYNIHQDRWRSIDLPAILDSQRGVSFSHSDTVIAIGRATRVDIIDLATFSVTELPHSFTAVADIVSVGSKFVIIGFTSSLLDINIYETSTQAIQTIELRGSVIIGSFHTWQNIFHFNYGTSRYLMTLSVMLHDMEDQGIFSGFSTNFTVEALGFGLSYNWRRNNGPINATGPTLEISNVQREHEGDYQVIITDQCSERMTQQARLTVNGPPKIIASLLDTILLCHETQNISITSEGKEVSFSWTISGDVHETILSPFLLVTGDSFSCNSNNHVCVTASNPAGSVNSCSTVRFVEVDRVFQGPVLASSSDLHFIGSSEELQLTIIEDWCTSHTWYADGRQLMTSTDKSSTLEVEVSRGMENTEFYVIAQCGNNLVKSTSFVFDDIAPLEKGHLILIIVLCILAVIGAIIGAVLAVRKLRQSAEHELELQDMLSRAKTESLQKDATPLIQATKWEWTPTDEFTYKSLDSLPFTIDTSQLRFGDSNDPLEVDMVAQSDVIFSLDNTKSKKQLKQPLLNDTRVDIYVPISPKYEITVEPSSFELSPNSSVHVAVSVRLRMTTRCKITLVVVLEQRKIYSAIEFKLSSKMSTWIDLEEIQMSGEFLGGGGFGSVVRGVYRGQDVAVKKLLTQYLTIDMKIEFEREVTLMKSLRHPNIVQFVGASNVTESLAIVIEYAPLGSLASVMEKQSLSVQLKVMCLLETAKALQFLHSNGVIHRDIKPQNILVFSLETRASVHVKLTDFGTSRFIADDPTTITKNVGTIAFMAPEALGRNPRIDKSADVYSFGVLMWSVLFEQVPFKDFKWDSDIEQHVKSGNRLPFPQGHDVDPSLIKLIETCWQHDPLQRPSMNSVVQQLSK